MGNRSRLMVAFGLVVATAAADSCSTPHPLEGAWSGELSADTARVPVELEFARARGQWRGLFTSSPLLMRWVPLLEVKALGESVQFAIPDVDAPPRFHGIVRGGRLRVSWEPTSTPPLPPFPVIHIDATRTRYRPASPYHLYDVRVASGGGVLSGTWLEPQSGPRPIPAVVLLHGSSVNERAFLLHDADRFARAGFGVLIYDKRGCGHSTGDLNSASLGDLVDDGVAAVRFARSRHGVDPDRVGVWGLSQGAALAPRVANESGAAFVVAVSGPGVPVTEIAAYQDSLRVTSHRRNRDEASAAAGLNRRLGTWLEGGIDDSTMAAALSAVAGAPWRRWSALPARLPDVVARRNWYWAGRLVDPLPAWKELRVPALLIYGENDELVPSRPSGTRIQRALEEAHHPDATVLWFTRANHALKRTIVPGYPLELPRGAPGYEDSTIAWMKRRVAPRIQPSVTRRP